MVAPNLKRCKEWKFVTFNANDDESPKYLVNPNATLINDPTLWFSSADNKNELC